MAYQITKLEYKIIQILKETGVPDDQIENILIILQTEEQQKEMLKWIDGLQYENLTKAEAIDTAIKAMEIAIYPKEENNK